MKPSIDDLHVPFPTQTPILVKFQFYRALHNILINDPEWNVLHATLAHLAEKPVHSIVQVSTFTFYLQYNSLQSYSKTSPITLLRF